MNNGSIYQTSTDITFIDDNLPGNSDPTLVHTIQRVRICENLVLPGSARYIANSFIMTVEQGNDPRITGQSLNNNQIYLINQYDTWEIEIDFSQPESVQNELGKFTTEVELRCPVGATHGIEGTGEGIVWKAASLVDYGSDFYIDDLIFKVKGEKHSITKVKTLASVDIEKVNSIKQFVDNVLTNARLTQGIQSLKELGLEPTIENTGAFLKWIGSDVIKEESDTMEGNELDRKDVMPIINREARQWYMKQQLNTI